MNPESEGMVVTEVDTDFETASEQIEKSIEESPTSLMTVFNHAERAQTENRS